MLTYPFNHDCQWRGPFYIWSSDRIDLEPPKDCKPVLKCIICGAESPASCGDNDGR